ncbi:MAG: M20/M25/M40 family metallo-hydrolase [Planctomycetes bacterium]|nr:M20/M25/M40 family metallo-hydrolase [Planctomycetota bacterium]
MRSILPAAALVAGLSAFSCFADPADDAAATIRANDMRSRIEFLASDELEGRATLQRGNDSAAKYIASEMRRIGLSPGGPNGSFFQDVPLWVSSYKYNYFLELRFKNDKERLEFEGFKHFTIGPGSGHDTVEGGVVFAGYGITAPEYGWDDYKDLNVSGKIVFVFRHEPRENDPKSVWDGAKMTKYASFEAKIANAKAHEAGGLVILNDPLGGHEPLFVSSDVVPEPLVTRTTVGFEEGQPPRNEQGGMPVVFATMETACRILHRTVDELSAIQKEIDEAGSPVTFAVEGELKMRTQVVGRLQTTEKKFARNVAGVLPGGNPGKMSEVLVIGAHYDHLGTSGSGDDTINNGADDNASGTSGMLEVAEAFCSMDKHPDRTILFVAFTGEEIGLLGSRYYVDHPLFPLASTAGMINLDMIGRNANDDPANARQVGVAGAGTSPSWRPLLESHTPGSKLDLSFLPQDPGGSDHAPFREKGVPVIFFFTGFHKDYHQVTDSADKINFQKSADVARLAFRVALDVADAKKRPEWSDPSGARPEHMEQGASAHRGEEIAIRQLSEEEARAAGLATDIKGLRVVWSKRKDLREGDVILEAGDEPVTDPGAFMKLLASMKGGSVSLFVERGKKGSLFVQLKGADLEGWRPGLK